MVSQIFVPLVGLVVILGSRTFEMGERSLGYDAARFQLFAVRSGPTSQTEETDERRQSEALQHQGGKNHAEGQENDHIAMRERRTVP